MPIADGGEGTVEALVTATSGTVHSIRVMGPLGEPVDAFFGVLGDSRTAVVEMAAASGLPLVPEGRRDPLRATSYGTGQLLAAALDTGCRRIILGIGGSATNDGGAGMVMALGARLLDEQGELIPLGAAGLERLHRIDASGLDPRLNEVEIVVASDVDNPLTGPEGATYVFGPQKGVKPHQLPRLDAALARFGDIIARDLGVDVAQRPGAGAAGGMGAAAMAFFGAALRPGADIVLDTVGFPAAVAGADAVLTGEGRLDAQTARGKGPAAVARLASQAGVPVIGVAGSVEAGADDALRELGFVTLLSIVDGPMDVKEAMERGESLLERTGRIIGSLLAVGRRWPHE